MKNLLRKIHKPYFYILLFISFALYFLYLPWSGPVIIKGEGQGKVELSLERSNGENFKRTVSFTKELEVHKLYFQKLLSYQILDKELKIEVNSESKSHRWSPKILFSIFFTSFMIVGFLVYLNTLFLRAKTIIPWLMHLGLLFLFLLALLPGLYNYDTFFLLKEIAEYRTSEFPGLYYHTLMMVFLQANPYPWTISAFNILPISVFLFHLYILADEFNLKKIYLLLCVVFYLYPSNIFMSLSASRDSVSHWLFFIFSVELYLTFIKKDFSRVTALRLGLIAGATSFLRPETEYIVIPYLTIMALFFYRQQIRWHFIIIGLLSIFIVSKRIIDYTNVGHTRHMKDVYQSTILINQLSYILKHKYETIPDEVNQRLGPYFKNDYLITYQVNDEIDPFHKGGLNSDKVDHYDQFRKESLKIFLEHPWLFIQNRLRLTQTIFNIGGDNNYLGRLNDYELQEKMFIEIKDWFSFESYEPIPFLSAFLKSIFDVLEKMPQFLAKSYLIPIMLMIIPLFLMPIKSTYYHIFFLHFMRAFLVILTAPAGHFKYHYALWLFGLFGTLCVIWERRLTLERKIGQNNLGN